ncbi:26S proteasome non-ATPase regulatory subunit 1 homolog A-like protein [Tanacetum coccineum]
MKHDSSFSQNPNDDMSFEELAEKSDLHLLLHALPWNSWNLTYCPLLAVLAQWRQKILDQDAHHSDMEPWKNLDPSGSTVTGKHSTATTMHGIMFDPAPLNKSSEASDDDYASASNGSGINPSYSGLPQTPRIVSLLSESYNPHVRYGDAMTVGISNAGMGLSEAISLLEPLTLDVTDFVRQDALIAMTMLMIQTSEASDSPVGTFRYLSLCSIKASIDLDSMKLAPKDIANVLPGMIRIIKLFPSTDMRMVVVGDKEGTIGFGMWIMK